MVLRKHMMKGLYLCLVSALIFLTTFIRLSAQDIDWKEVANTNNEIQLIDVNSLKYNKSGLLSVMLKYNEIDPENQNIINSNVYLMAIDCENRLFSKLPINGDVLNVKKWSNPNNDKLTKTTIINSCSL
ncbi:hypothetical protein [Prochlorococcus marinus]|uniref:hypothetical protein n=1 Tax=Prochlorococcus marinus TaxID=1219 RepID=UPI001C56C13C|nr:hypothetical protein [Prochlorococcus marinus]MBW3042181.1 hypothetical protein [Prochlorococcus marinus str. XMU1408]